MDEEIKLHFPDHYTIDATQKSEGGNLMIDIEAYSRDSGKDEVKSIRLPITATPGTYYNEVDELEMDIRFKMHTGMNAGTIALYDKTTILFETESFDELKRLFDNYPEIEEIAVMKKRFGTTTFFVPPKKVEYQSKFSDYNPTMTAAKKEVMAYETPSLLLESFLRSLQRARFDYEVKGIAEKISKMTHNDLSTTNAAGMAVGDIYAPLALASLTDYLVIGAKDSTGKSQELFLENLDGDNADAMREFILKKSEAWLADKKVSALLRAIDLIQTDAADKGYDAAFRDNAEAWKGLTGRGIKTPTIPIFDPQAGSGEGLFAAMDRTGFDGTLVGTELRDISSDDPRFQVKTGVDTLVMASSISEAMASRRAEYAVYHTPVWINPPYTSEDTVLKQSIEMLPNTMMISGIFPVKAEQFLNKHLSGQSLILDIPKEKTGYEDPKAPQRFLYVVGTISHKKDNEGRERSLLTVPTKKVLPDNGDINAYIMTHFQKEPGFVNHIGSSYTYFHDDDNRRNILQTAVSDAIQSTEWALKNTEAIKKVAMTKVEEIQSMLHPIEAAKKRKVFPDPRFYQEDGKYPRLRFFEVANNIPLLSYYRQNMPGMFELTKSVADASGMTLPIDESKVEPFRFTEKYQGEKDKVTSLALGMMRLYYYPSNISLKAQADKDALFALLLKYSNDRGINFDVEHMKQIIGDSHSLVMKGELVVHDSKIIPTEAFVLLDEYGFDIGKIEMLPDDFYKYLELMDTFDIYDYVEISQLSTSQKKQLMESFVERTSGVVGMIARENGMSTEELNREIMIKTMGFFRDLKAGKISREDRDLSVIAFGREKGIYQMIEATQKVNWSSTKREIIEAFAPLDLGGEAQNMIAEYLIDNFRDKPIKFYEEWMPGVLENISDKVKKKYGSKFGNEDELHERLMEAGEGVGEALTPIYLKKLVAGNSASKLSDVLLGPYGLMRYHLNEAKNEPDYDKLYDGAFRKMFLETLELKEHQFAEAENFLALSDEKKMEQLSWMPRAGKMRAAIAIQYLLALKQKSDIFYLLETANMNDAVLQLTESFPMLALTAKQFVDKSKIETNPDATFDLLPFEEAYPNPFKILPQRKFYRAGEGATEELKQYGTKFNDILSAMDEKYGTEISKATIEEVLAQYKDSPFKDVLIKTGC